RCPPARCHRAAGRPGARRPPWPRRTARRDWSASPSGPAAPGAVGQGWGAARPRLHPAPEWCRSCVSSVITLSGLLGFLRGRRYAIGVPLGVTRDGDDAVARVGFRENDPLGGAPGEVDLADGGAHDL